jgi:hypothetical protein
MKPYNDPAKMNADIRTLQEYYRGFFISEPLGNNAFSYPQRGQRTIYVPPIIQGSCEDLAVGNEFVFSEVEEGEEINRRGLKQFVYINSGEKDFFVFDNHNHAFFFWVYAYKTGKLKKGLPLVHVDQHSDMREPAGYFPLPSPDAVDLGAAFDYTNYVLNVGNFIKPALAAGLFSTVEIINDSVSFETEFTSELVLDLDLDVFSPEMAYINDTLKMEKIRQYVESAGLITIATSPYFMEQEKAIRFIKALFRVVD